ncbi:MAG: hypothetical protein ACLQU5_16225 [Isosphaeraceae bacterium]
METLNCVRELNFSGPHIGARFVSGVRDCYVGSRSVVVNPNRTDVVIDSPRVNVISPFSSVILRDVYIASAESIIVLELREMTNLGDIVFEPGWALYGTLIPDAPPDLDPAAPLPFPRNTPLWRSPQDEIGYVTFDPGTLPGQKDSARRAATFLVKVNFWFAPANTNCFIHNQHAFIEIHSQITGYGRMQKFRTQDYSTLYHDELMSPGYTTAVPFCEVAGPGRYVYPWHQYYADGDCIWMAVEYHPAG